VHNGTHSGDWISSKQALVLLEEVRTVLHTGKTLDDPDNDFFVSVKRLCEASIATGNPIVF